MYFFAAWLIPNTVITEIYVRHVKNLDEPADLLLKPVGDVVCSLLTIGNASGVREPWHQSRRGSHKISPNGAKIGLGVTSVRL